MNTVRRVFEPEINGSNHPRIGIIIATDHYGALMTVILRALVLLIAGLLPTMAQETGFAKITVPYLTEKPLDGDKRQYDVDRQSHAPPIIRKTQEKPGPSAVIR